MWMLRNRIRIITDYGKSVVTGIGCNAFYFGRETQTHLFVFERFEIIKTKEYGHFFLRHGSNHDTDSNGK